MQNFTKRGTSSSFFKLGSSHTLLLQDSNAESCGIAFASYASDIESQKWNKL